MWDGCQRDIECIEVGDEVLCSKMEDKEQRVECCKKVVKGVVSRVEEYRVNEYVTIHFSDDKRIKPIETTITHPMFVETHGYCAVLPSTKYPRKLQVGDRIPKLTLPNSSSSSSSPK